uniref:Galanin peptides-like n=1 Tax=Pogona vitticeps TaxID=103695 RepID=A0A6J0TQV9_9SAUR|nr:galanin peptides-like isoform X1 [Pogona vitticeps]
MWNSSRYIFCFSLLLCGLFGECFGMALLPKDKRGWTLNSAGYLLGHPLLPFYSPLPKADAHQTLSDKGILGGKRDALENFYSQGQDSFAQPMHPSDEANFQTLMDFLSYLNLQDQRAVSHQPEESL